ncbi:MAG: response regulator [Lachnospiraceae bacterium]|nr:response regulator [Lachnospiraceae bacterium]
MEYSNATEVQQNEQELRYKEQLGLTNQAAKDALAYASYNLTQNVVLKYESNQPELCEIMGHEKADDVLAGIRNIACEVRDPEDFALLSNCTTMIKAYKCGRSHIEVRHRLKNDNRWVLSVFDMIANSQTGDIEAISFLRNITDITRSELVVNRLMTLDYQSIIIVDTSTGVSIPFRKSKEDGVLTKILQMQEELGDVREGLNAFFRKYAVSGTAEKAIKENSPEYINVKLETEPYYECTYALNWQGKKHHYRIVYSYLEQRAGEILCAIQDVTDIYEQEEEQRARLTAALEESNAANQAKTAFLSRISHDMRTPLNGILGLTTLLKDSTTDDKILRDLMELEMSGKYLLNLINDTLDMNKIESGKLELHPHVCEGKTLFNNALGLAKSSIQAKNLQLHVQTENIPFTTLYVDVERIEQVVLNVLGNAVKFTPDGGTIEVTMSNISICDGVITDKLVIRDSGIGISREFLPHVFEAFSQEDATRTSAYQGTGLGLAITKQLIQLMGGNISVESEQGKGTSFTIILKMDIATEEQIAEWKKSQISSDNGINLYGKKALLCEDHPLNAKIATRLLETKGMIVDHAENGQIGVELFQDSAIGYYDVVLMDIRMPVMDGIDAVKTIRNLPRRDARLVPIIAMTANAFDDDVKQTRDAGMDAHLSKPIQTELLYQTMGDLMKVDYDVKRQKILIVDDIELNRAVIMVSLENDYEIMEAENGKQAMQILETTRGIDAVITDIQMPEMDGVELIKQIRSNNVYRHIVIIANTQFGDPEQEENLLQIGANDFVYKPTTPKIVEIRVRNALRRI